MNTPANSSKKRKVGAVSIIIVLLLLLVIEGIVLFVFIFIDKSDNDISQSSPKLGVLVVAKDNENDESELSDGIQIVNAIQNGGLIKIKTESDWISNHFPAEYVRYGAMNSNGVMWTDGAYLNFIAHKGWQLIAVEDNVFYFVPAI